MTPEEAVARALCRYTVRRSRSGNLEDYVENHWRDHAAAAQVAIRAMDAWRFNSAGITGDVGGEKQ